MTERDGRCQQPEPVQLEDDLALSELPAPKNPYLFISERLVLQLYRKYIWQWNCKIKFPQLPVRYEVNCFGPQRMGKRAVVFIVFCEICIPSRGKNCVPLDDSPHQRSLTNMVVGGLWTVHSTRLITTLRKHLSSPSTRGGRLVEGSTSLGTAKETLWLK